MFEFHDSALPFPTGLLHMPPVFPTALPAPISGLIGPLVVGAEDSKVHTANVEADALKEIKVAKHAAIACAL